MSQPDQILIQSCANLSSGNPTTSEVGAQLQRILESAVFCNAPRHSRFLLFVVNKALAGEHASIKEYLIGMEAFDRTSGFDTSVDATVRAEARRLRQRLKKYYESAGVNDPILLDIPKGSYVPTFRRNETTRHIATEGQPAADNHGRTVEGADTASRVALWHNHVTERIGYWFVAIVLALCLFAGWEIHRAQIKKTHSSMPASRPASYPGSGQPSQS